MLRAESASLASLWIEEVSRGGAFDGNMGKLHLKTVGRGLAIMACLPDLYKGQTEARPYALKAVIALQSADACGEGSPEILLNPE